MNIQQEILRLKTKPPLTEQGNTLRGYFANRFPEYDILHNHKKDGKFLYMYPRIQYRIVAGEAYLIGIEEGCSVIRFLEPQIETINLKGAIYQVVQKQLISKNAEFGIADNVKQYMFIKPWLALNKKNYDEYIRCGHHRKKEQFLKNILAGNLISISKSLGYIVDQQIVVESLALKELEVFLKGTPMIGFLGTFSVNFEIPDYWGIGKSVSRGFGTVERTGKRYSEDRPPFGLTEDRFNSDFYQSSKA